MLFSVLGCELFIDISQQLDGSLCEDLDICRELSFALLQLNRSDSDSSMPLYKRGPFQRNTLERKSLRWKKVSQCESAVGRTWTCQGHCCLAH